ncbi:MAG: DUF4422 domain-containing protein [Bacteroidales bacterium]|nr:DUF4422 domain-containing protein [Bacteroidales bacterium]
MKEIKIFVFQHTPCQLPQCFSDRSIYVPVQCGRAINEKIPGTIDDNTGNNISSLNIRFNEMTAIYWIAYHYEEIGNPEYIGFNHYRRYLNWNKEMLSRHTVIARRWFSWRTLRSQYANCHNIEDLDEFSRHFKSVFSADDNDYSDYDAYWKTHFFHICNMFIMHRDNFKRYAKFILKCIDILMHIEVGKSTATEQNRAPGFILEAMTSYWIWHEKRKRTITLVPSTITHFHIENSFNGSTCIDKHVFLWFLRHAY